MRIHWPISFETGGPFDQIFQAFAQIPPATIPQTIPTTLYFSLKHPGVKAAAINFIQSELIHQSYSATRCQKMTISCHFLAYFS